MTPTGSESVPNLPNECQTTAPSAESRTKLSRGWSSFIKFGPMWSTFGRSLTKSRRARGGHFSGGVGRNCLVSLGQLTFAITDLWKAAAVPGDAGHGGGRVPQHDKSEVLRAPDRSTSSRTPPAPWRASNFARQTPRQPTPPRLTCNAAAHAKGSPPKRDATDRNGASKFGPCAKTQARRRAHRRSLSPERSTSSESPVDRNRARP